MERKLIVAAVSSALALPMAAQAVEFAVSGHVNRAIVSIDGTGGKDDGDLKHKDGRTSPSRFPLHGQRGAGQRDDGRGQLGIRRRRVT